MKAEGRAGLSPTAIVLHLLFAYRKKIFFKPYNYDYFYPMFTTKDFLFHFDDFRVWLDHIVSFLSRVSNAIAESRFALKA